MTTWDGIAGIGLGRLLGRGHDLTPWSGVEAPRLSRLCCIVVVVVDSG